MNKNRNALPALCLTVALATPLATASGQTDLTQTFTPSCQSAAGGRLLVDPEFEPNSMLATWQDDPVVNSKGVPTTAGKVYIAPVNPTTGVIETQSQIVFASANPVAIRDSKNGPEWGCTQGSCSVYFTSYLSDKTNVRMGVIDKDDQGTWQVAFLPQSNNKNFGFASLDIDETGPVRVHYANTSGNFSKGTFSWTTLGWRHDISPPDDGTLGSGSKAGRWVPGTQQLAYIRTVGSQYQVQLLDVGSGITDVVSATGNTRTVAPFPWRAPELAGEVAILSEQSTSNGATEIQVFAKDAEGVWHLYNTITPPDPAYPNLGSPEPFVFDGKSYITFVARASGFQRIQSQIWIASVDPTLATPIRQLVSTEPVKGKISNKTDPEPLVINNGTKAVIYYTDNGANTVPQDLKLCEAGLTAAPAPAPAE